MIDPDRPDHCPGRLPTGSHHARARAEQIAEGDAMIRLWERAVFRDKRDAREQLAFWRGVLAKLEADVARLQDAREDQEPDERPADR